MPEAVEVRKNINRGTYAAAPHTVNKPMMIFRGASTTARVAYVKDIAVWREAQTAWQKRQEALYAVFKKDLLKELGVAGHPKADRLYYLAWAEGHGNGLTEVVHYAEELVTLLTPVSKKKKGAKRGRARKA